MARSHYGAGTVLQVGPDRWRLYVSLGRDPVTGKHRRATRTVTARTGKEANAALAAFVGAQHTTGQAGTLSALLVEYLDSCHGMSPSTRADFDGYIRRCIPGHLGTLRVKDLTARHLDGLYSHLLAKGNAKGGKLAAASVRRVHTILHAALEQAVRWDYITANPAARARPPELERTEVTLPSADALVRLLAAVDAMELDRPGKAAGSLLPDFLALDLAVGARPGELCALTWGDIDLKTGRVTIAKSVARGQGTAVVKSTKTGRARRVNLPADVVDVLKARLARWRPSALAAGIPVDQLPVFPSKDRAGRPWRPDSVSREFRAVRDSLDLSDDLTLRNLRHYCVSVLAAGGVDVVTVAKRMGHSPQIMLTVYAHMFEASDQAAADLLGANTASLRGR